MAEAALFGLARNLLTTIGSFEPGKGRQRPHLEKEYGKIKTSIEAIRDVLLDAEKKQESSAAVKCWIKDAGDVLYEAEDLLNEISTAEDHKQQMEENKILNQVREVRDLFSRSNIFSQATGVRGRFKALSKSLDRISDDSEMFWFDQIQSEVTGGCEEESCVDFNGVVGREEDKESIVRFLLEDSNVEINVVAIVGIGGMGKSTLAQLVYSDERVRERFQNRWWASISGIDSDREILRRIGKAIGVEKALDLKEDELKVCIKKSVGESGKYLLVIDGVRDDNHTKWSNRMKLLLNDSEGCRIVITTRSSSAAKAMEATRTHMLCGLSDVESWRLFEAMAFPQEKEGDPAWEKLAKKIATKCSGVPLALRRIAMLLPKKTQLEDRESFMNVVLSKVALSENIVLSVLKLSYDQFPSDLKQCFAYCSLFPKGHVISKHKLLCLWIAQGYINEVSSEKTFEEVGEEYFQRLLSLHFLQKSEQDEVGEIEHYKMYDLVHDLAQLVAGDQTAAILTDQSSHDPRTRHVSVGHEIILPQLLSDDRLRSCVFMVPESCRTSPFDPQQLTKFRFLRALDMSELVIQDVSCIEGFKLLRYLNLSRNPFESLPNSISELCNLLSLDISWCKNLKAWPQNMRRLTKLRHLDYCGCPGLMRMPDGFGELTNLQHLSGFEVGCRNNELEELSRMLKPKGKLKIEFGMDMVGNEGWQLPATVQVLEICSYLGEFLPHWNHKTGTEIVRLELHRCEKLKRLPALRILRNLKTLVVNAVKEVEYVEEDDAGTTSSLASFPCLENLSLIQLPGLKGWTPKENHLNGRIFPALKELEIVECPEWYIWGNGVEWDSLSALRNLRISPMPTPDKLPDCLEQRMVKVMEGSPPRIEEDRLACWPTPADSQPRTREEDKGSKSSSSRKRWSNMVKSPRS